MCCLADTNSGDGDMKDHHCGKASGRKVKTSHSRGFTLIELLVSMVIGLIVIAALVDTYQRFVAATTAQNVSADLQLSGRAALEFMVREIRMAGFTKSTPDKDKFGVEVAQSSKIRFTRDQINLADPDDGVGEVEDNKEEIITYFLDNSDGGLKRQLNEGTVNMTRQPLIGGADGQIQVTNFDLTYLRSNGTVIPSPNTSQSIIRSIIITLTVQAPAGKAGMIERTFVNRVRCRNLGL